MERLLTEIRQCTLCKPHLTDGVNPVLAAHKNSKVVIIGQAPGRIVHQSGIPWKDKSGDRLRKWLGVTDKQFYNPELFALIPMGFCFPGKGTSGDLPPRKECAPLWHPKLMKSFNTKPLVILIGTYAQEYYLKQRIKTTITETVQNYLEYLPDYIVLPHPSPRNNIWLKKNPWFDNDIIPVLQIQVTSRINAEY